MRARNEGQGIAVRAIGGTHVVTLGLDADPTQLNGLLGFAIKRDDLTENESYWLRGAKTFQEVVPIQRPGVSYSLLEQPVQSFRWADYTAKPAHRYRYTIVPMRGKPKKLEQGTSVPIEIATETEGDPNAIHDVYFNRGVAGSQAYAEKFGDRPDNLSAQKKEEALTWLSRGLLEAMLAFIGRAQGSGDSLCAAVYEFDYPEVLKAFKAAKERGAEVRILYDARHDSPKKETEKAIRAAGIASLCRPRKTGRALSHNKFIVRLKDGRPVDVWTGSTNFTMSGIYGQSNVGHVVRDERIAGQYHQYWTWLSKDPEYGELRSEIVTETPDPDGDPPANDVLTIFSPRENLDVLQWYATRTDDARSSVHMTAAFGVNDLFEQVFAKEKDYLRYVLLDKADNNQLKWTKDKDVRVAVGAKIPKDALYAWAEETLTGYSVHVKYIHDKFLLLDPLSDNPIVITGSANFSEASTNMNDENMLVIRGDTRVADIYLGEFMRLFSHLYFRDLERKRAGETKGTPRNLYLAPDDSWTRQYFAPGSVKSKERTLFSGARDEARQT